jgi:hypothetical protein
MATVTVNKLDKQNDESEFEIETLDDIQSGGASTASTGTPNLSVPLNNNSIKVNSLEKENDTPNKSEKMQTNPISSTSNKPASAQESVKANAPMSEPKRDEEDESEFPAEENEDKETPVNTPKSSESKLQSTQEADKELVNNLESAQKNNVTPELNTTQLNTEQINTAQKTKKKVKKVKKVGATKKKVVAQQQTATPINNDVQPHVEFGNERGTMTIKYASAKTTVPLYSSAKSSHLDLASIKSAFDTEYDAIKAMTTEQVTELRHEMQNTEFSELGSEALIHGLLSLIDDHDTKKLTLKMMLARGLLKVKA